MRDLRYGDDLAPSRQQKAVCKWLVDEQILGFGAVVEAKEDEAGVVAAL